NEEWLKIKPKEQLPRGPLPLPAKLSPPFDRLPPQVQDQRRWAMSLPRPANVITGGDVRDIRADLDEVYRLTRHNQGEHPLGGMPLTVITKAPENSGPIPREQLDYNMRVTSELSRLSRRGKYIVAQTADHHIQLTQPKLVICAIRDIIAAVRS